MKKSKLPPTNKINKINYICKIYKIITKTKLAAPLIDQDTNQQTKHLQNQFQIIILKLQEFENCRYLAHK